MPSQCIDCHNFLNVGAWYNLYKRCLNCHLVLHKSIKEYCFCATNDYYGWHLFDIKFCSKCKTMPCKNCNKTIVLKGQKCHCEHCVCLNCTCIGCELGKAHYRGYIKGKEIFNNEPQNEDHLKRLYFDILSSHKKTTPTPQHQEMYKIGMMSGWHDIIHAYLNPCWWAN